MLGVVGMLPHFGITRLARTCGNASGMVLFSATDLGVLTLLTLLTKDIFIVFTRYISVGYATLFNGCLRLKLFNIHFSL